MVDGCYRAGFKGSRQKIRKTWRREPFNRAGASLGISLNYWFGVARRVEVAIPCRGARLSILDSLRLGFRRFKPQRRNSATMFSGLLTRSHEIRETPAHLSQESVVAEGSQHRFLRSIKPEIPNLSYFAATGLHHKPPWCGDWHQVAKAISLCPASPSLAAANSRARPCRGRG
jgi:hypothetical protein